MISFWWLVKVFPDNYKWYMAELKIKTNKQTAKTATKSLGTLQFSFSAFSVFVSLLYTTCLKPCSEFNEIQRNSSLTTRYHWNSNRLLLLLFPKMFIQYPLHFLSKHIGIHELELKRKTALSDTEACSTLISQNSNSLITHSLS